MGGAGFTIHGPAGDQKRDEAFGEPDIKPVFERGLLSGDDAGDEGGSADGHLAAPGDPGERRRALHGLAYVAKVIDRAVMKGAHRLHAEHIRPARRILSSTLLRKDGVNTDDEDFSVIRQ